MMQMADFNQRPAHGSEVFCSGIVFNCTIDVREDIKSKKIELPEFQLSGVLWQVGMWKKSIGPDDNRKEVIAIYLTSSMGTQEKWSCEAQASFKLCNADDNNSMIQYLPKQKFSNNSTSYGIESFIEWNEFIQHFVYKDKAMFEIKIFANPLLCKGPIEIEETGRVVRHTIKNVSKLGECHSDEFIVRGMKWIVVTKRNDSNLEAYLVIPNENDLDKNWSWKAHVVFKLMSFDRNVRPVQIAFNEVFRWGMNSWGIHVMKWAEFIDPKKHFVAHDSAILFTDLRVEPAEPLWDSDDLSLI